MRNCKLYRKSKHIFLKKSLAWKSCLLWDNVEKYGGAREATHDNIISHMRFACWTTNATKTHTHEVEYAILIAFPRKKNCHSNAPECYITRTLPVLFKCFSKWYIYIYIYIYKQSTELQRVSSVTRQHYRNWQLHGIWRPHGGDYVYCCLLKRDAV